MADLLAAIYAVARSAQRHHEHFRRQLDEGQSDRAKESKRHKERLRSLQYRGIAAAAVTGRLAPVEIEGSLCIYRGEGYKFFANFVPQGCELAVRPIDDPKAICERPAGSQEVGTADVIAMLDRLPEVDLTVFRKLTANNRERRTKTEKTKGHVMPAACEQRLVND